MDVTLIQQRAIVIRERIRRACERVGRNPEEVTLVAVSKTFPESLIVAAHAAGLRHFGENKAQEFAQKVDAINAAVDGNITWHFIGHIQRNKVKLVAGRAHLIHGVDSLRLARSLQDYAERHDLKLHCLVQVNVSGESSKFGLDPSSLTEFLVQVRSFDRISVDGLMTLATPAADDARLRTDFRRLRDCLDGGRSVIKSLRYLSMGMSGDFEIAVEEGATHVRLGSMLFGQRDR